MNENSYQKLMSDIHTPAGLNDRVLFAARQRAAEETAEKHKRLVPRKRHPALLRTAVCAACALALVAGTFTLRPAEDGIVPVPQYEFALTACASDAAPGANGGLALSAGGAKTEFTYLDLETLEKGRFSEAQFHISGEGIGRVSLSIDRGGLYRKAEGREPEGVGERIEEPYDPVVSYGFWTRPVNRFPMPNTLEDVDLNGATLTVTVTYDDGTEQTERYLLTEETLRAFTEADGTVTLAPGLEGDEAADLFGIYAVDQSKSRWLSWPVQGSNTVSLSAPYGKAPNGNIHDGIDIPAQQGTPVLAAADGTVVETGFDTARGNYLVLDHGDGLTTVYGQCRNVDVEQGDAVKAGEMVGAVGATGMATGPHLHFEVRRDENPENPVAYFDAATRATLRAE